jgi:prephenate dehydratase
VQTGTATHGVVPFENSSNGSVVFTLDLFADLAGRYPDILVSGETYLGVHHCLVGRSPDSQGSASSKPGQQSKLARKLEDVSTSGTATPTQATPTPAKPRVKPAHDVSYITKLYSHPQAWGQCKIFLSACFKGIERLDVSSTSKAAELVAKETNSGNGNGTTSAAISSRIAAEMNGLDILAEGIEDKEGNSTRFFVIRKRKDNNAEQREGAGAQDDSEAERSNFKTLVTFTVEHGEPGALADCLAVFKKHNLNLTSINTRPSGEAAWHYIFFVEVMGRKLPESAGGAVNEALQELGQVAKGWRWLGSWENALKSS